MSLLPVEAVHPGQEAPVSASALLPAGRSRLICGDCLPVMRGLPDASFDLIYIDPPFFSGRRYKSVFGDRAEHASFSDVWAGGIEAYLGWLQPRLEQAHRLLKVSGSLYVHLDWHAVHYAKVALDGIFGYERFQNEIAWCYSVGGKSRRRWARKHDSILFYTRSDDYYFDGAAVGTVRETGRGSFGGIIATDDEGRRYQDKKDRRSGRYYRYYLDAPKIPEDWWSDINSLQSQSAERLGYPTQKPRALLERIVLASCPPGGVVGDFFCGGGTTIEAAQCLGRQWVGCDASWVAVALSAHRVARSYLADAPAPGRQLLDGIVARPPQLTLEGALREAVASSQSAAPGFEIERVEGHAQSDLSTSTA